MTEEAGILLFTAIAAAAGAVGAGFNSYFIFRLNSKFDTVIGRINGRLDGLTGRVEAGEKAHSAHVNAAGMHRGG